MNLFWDNQKLSLFNNIPRTKNYSLRIDFNRKGFSQHALQKMEAIPRLCELPGGFKKEEWSLE